MRRSGRVLALLLLAGLAGCGSGDGPKMPDVTGKKLDVAKSDIERTGFEDDPEVLGGGILGILKESNWEVCEQTPAPGEPLTKAPRLEVERDCKGEAEPSEEPSPEPSEGTSPEPSVAAVPTEQPEAPPPVATDITVDALLDKLNSANMGGIKTGDRFRVTAELSGAEYWGTGAAGEYTVNMKAKGGANDLPFFVDEALTRGWRDGTRVEMVLEAVEATINGETTDGWLKARTVRTLS